MMQELIYTSVPRGLKPGTRGFCTVASTQQMTQPLAERLESLSGYRHLYAAHEPQAHLNPVIHSHLVLTVGGRKYHVLSRIADAGLDYTHRSNKFAHHVALEGADLPAGGPAWLLMQPGFIETRWEGDPKLLPAGRRPPDGFAAPAVCRHWQALTGDAGWAGVLAETGANASAAPACILFAPGQDLLPLVAEALALLPMERRWQVTFSTWYTKLPPDIDCQWRFFLADSAEAKAAHRQHRGLWIDLTAPMPKATAGKWVEAARTGVVSAVVQAEAKPAAAAPTGQPPRSVAVGAAAPPLDPAEFGFDLAALPPRPPGPAPALPRLSRAPAKSSSNWKVWAVAGAMAAMLLLTTAIGLVGFYVGRSTERHLAGAPRQTAVLPTEPVLTSPAADAAIVPPPAEGPLPNEVQGEGDGDDTMENAGPDVGTPPAPADGNGGTRSPLDPAVESEPSPKGDPQAKPAPDTGTNGSPAKPPPPRAEVPEPEKHDPFENFPLEVDLPRDEVKTSMPLGTVVATAADAIKLEIVGWNVFAGQSYELDVAAKDNSTWALLLRNPNIPVSVSGREDALGEFKWEHNELSFAWKKSRKGDNDPHDWLRNCVLSLAVDEYQAHCSLRAPIYLAPTGLQFAETTHFVDIKDDLHPRGIPESPEAINRAAIELQVDVHGVSGATVHNASGADSEKERANDLARAQDGKSKAGKGSAKASSPATNAKLTTIRLPFEPGRDVEVDVKLLLQKGKPPVLHFANFGFSQDSPGAEPERIALSTTNVAEWQQKMGARLAKHSDALRKAKEGLDDLGEPKKDDPRATERQKLNDAISREKQAAEFYEQEQTRCSNLLKLLERLHGNARITVFYRVPQVDGEDLKVVLAETEPQ